MLFRKGFKNQSQEISIDDKKILTEILKLNKIKFRKIYGKESELSKKPIKFNHEKQQKSYTPKYNSNKFKNNTK